jgi:nitrogen fixation/metabolism regulation signal transduction histidine kinase
LVLLGVISVGASAYLVSLTVRYFDDLGDAQVQVAQDAIDQALPFYEGLVAAKREAFDARTHALVVELSQLAGEEEHRARMRRELERGDVVGLRLSVGGGRPLAVEAPNDDRPRIDVESEASVGSVQLAAVYGVDPAIERRFQALGQVKRDLSAVDVEGSLVERDELERAVFSAIAVASLAVLLVAFVAGFGLARSTTRKVSGISDVMRRISSGDLDARAPPLGEDEIGVLASDLNGMLDQLDQARKKVAYLQRIGAWQEMARRIAHEIKNPLTPIQLAAQQLREKDPKLNAEFSKLLLDSVEIIEDEIEGLRRMVSSFSQFAKVPEVKLEPTDLSKLVEEFHRAYGHLGDGEEDELSVVGVDEPVEVMADRQLLKQVLVNLVENATLSAREHVDGPVRVQVGLTASDALVELFVEDNGPGIVQAKRERVFEPYETTREEGTGLGLAIVKKVILDHGGEISVEDGHELSGARFVIRLQRTVA